jgi:plasmid stabilization system protein ParE
VGVARRPIVWTRLASNGLHDALEYISRRHSLEATQKALEVILKTCESLATLPNRGRVVPELKRESIREVFCYRYRIIYEVTPEEVRILAFVHGARDFDRWLQGL